MLWLTCDTVDILCDDLCDIKYKSMYYFWTKSLNKFRFWVQMTPNLCLFFCCSEAWIILVDLPRYQVIIEPGPQAVAPTSALPLFSLFVNLLKIKSWSLTGMFIMVMDLKKYFIKMGVLPMDLYINIHYFLALDLKKKQGSEIFIMLLLKQKLMEKNLLGYLITKYYKRSKNLNLK